MRFMSHTPEAPQTEKEGNVSFSLNLTPREQSLKKDSFRCITIVHPADRIKEYRWFSAFFRLAGIWVCENILGSEHGDDTDFLICIHGADNPEWKDISYLGPGITSPQFLPSDSSMAYSEQNWLTAILASMEDYFQHDTFQELKQISDCFVQHELMRSSYAIEYFGDTGSLRIYEYMGTSKEHFYAAYQSLKTLETPHSSKYLLAAICNCQRRINELHTIIWNAMLSRQHVEQREFLSSVLQKIPFQPYEEIEQRISRILAMDPNFYAAYAIRGFAKRTEDQRMMEFVYDFERAIILCGKHSYTSYLLYRMGKYFEVIRQDDEFAESYYSHAFHVDPHNYRAIFKLAMYQKKRNSWREALKLWDLILDLLKEKETSQSLQPIECAYLYKTYMNIGETLIQLRNYEKSIYALERAKSFGSSDRNMAFYQWMFGETYAPVFKAAAVEKLRLYDCYANLTDAYAMVNSYEKILQTQDSEDAGSQQTGSRYGKKRTHH